MHAKDTMHRVLGESSPVRIGAESSVAHHDIASSKAWVKLDRLGHGSHHTGDRDPKQAKSEGRLRRRAISLIYYKRGLYSCLNAICVRARSLIVLPRDRTRTDWGGGERGAGGSELDRWWQLRSFRAWPLWNISLGRTTGNRPLLSPRDQAVLLPVIGQVTHTTHELAVIAGILSALGNEVHKRAAVTEHRVPDVTVTPINDHRGAEI